LNNDKVLPNDCKLDDVRPRFLVSPDGFVLFQCVDSKSWRDNGGQHVYLGESGDASADPLVHLGYGNLALTATRVIDLASGTGPTITGLPPATTHAVRAVSPDKFWLVRGGSDPLALELWEIDRTGKAQRVGQYANPTDDSAPVTPEGRLDKTGALLQLARRTGDPLEDVILRRDVAGKCETVYTESTKPLVRIHISGLVTGP
jgi:hypothetical protein